MARFREGITGTRAATEWLTECDYFMEKTGTQGLAVMSVGKPTYAREIGIAPLRPFAPPSSGRKQFAATPGAPRRFWNLSGHRWSYRWESTETLSEQQRTAEMPLLITT